VITVADDTEALTVSVEEAARLLGIGRGTAYECVRTGQIPAIRLGGRIVIPRRALHAMVEAAAAKLESQ
jgi:excisionase family DNA binding protein